MTRELPEAWARRGTAQDIIFLVRMYEQLNPTCRQKLLNDAVRLVADRATLTIRARDGNPIDAVDWLKTPTSKGHPNWDKAVNLVGRCHRMGNTGCDSELASVVIFLDLHALLDGDGIFVAAVEALATDLIGEVDSSDMDEEDLADWLTEVAEGSYPTGEEVARLIGFASDVETGWKSFIFPDGLLEPVLCASEAEYSQGECIFEGYKYLFSVTDSYDLMPEPASHLHVKVNQEDFSEFSFEEGWTLNKAAFDDEVRHQCILHFASFVATWRANFFEALLALGQSHPRR